MFACIGLNLGAPLATVTDQKKFPDFLGFELTIMK
jgi:hypothetical protein